MRRLVCKQLFKTIYRFTHEYDVHIEGNQIDICTDNNYKIINQIIMKTHDMEALPSYYMSENFITEKELYKIKYYDTEKELSIFIKTNLNKNQNLLTFYDNIHKKYVVVYWYIK